MKVLVLEANLKLMGGERAEYLLIVSKRKEGESVMN